MPTERKVKEVEALTERFSSASMVIATDYRGIPVQSMDRLRRSLREKGAHYRVAKNTLARIAADRAGRPEIKQIVAGPCAYVITDGDAAAAAAALTAGIRAERLGMAVLGAVLGKEVLSTGRLEQLASLPGREELLAQLLARMNAPITGLVAVLSAPLRGLATVLQRRAEQLAAGTTAGAS